MFSHVSSRGGAGYVHGMGILGVGMPGVGISRVGLGMSRGWVPSSGREISSRTHRPLLDMKPGIPWDMVGKRVVSILLECFLVQSANGEGNCNYINLHI